MNYKNDVVSVSSEQIRTLRRKYNKAVKHNDKSFMFMGREVLTAYAKYLLQYLDMKRDETQKVLVGVVPMK